MSVCVVIPVFNPGLLVTPAVEAASEVGLHCILVDDGSEKETQKVLEDLADRSPGLTIFRHPQNQGKGAAVMTGIRLAEEQGFHLALQIDADGQHDTGDLQRFIRTAEEHPGHLVLGCPVYDESVPRHRFYCRYLTHVLVWLECLSFAIRDSMCGFRIYPVRATLDIHRKHPLPARMDFDTEAAVRLYWSGVPVVNLKTRVQYPEDGTSNFRMFRDNVRMTCMHIRLLFGMLVRSPVLLARRFRRHD